MFENLVNGERIVMCKLTELITAARERAKAVGDGSPPIDPDVEPETAEGEKHESRTREVGADR